MTVLVWNYHDDDVPAPAATVALTIEGAAAGRPRVTHYRVDDEHGNSYATWKKMGSPLQPTPSQYSDLERAGKLKLLAPPQRVAVEKGRISLAFPLPRQAVSLIEIDY
jgi:xylan 1,4-beta-xylosidase